MTTTNRTKLAFLSFCNALITGLTALANADNVQAKGTTFTKAQILAPLLAYVLLPPKTKAAKAAYSQALADEKAAEAAARAMAADVIEPYLRTRFGKDSTALETYGMQPVKAPKKSVATKAAAAQKSQATRKALGTKGPVQKKEAKKAVAVQPTTPAPVPATPVKA